MRVPTLATLVAVVAVSASCDTLTNPGVSDLDGTYNYNAFELTAPGLSCSMFSVSLVLAQLGSSFTGTIGEGRLECSGQLAAAASQTYRANVVVNGRIEDSAVTFDIGSPNIHHVGVWNPPSFVFPKGSFSGQVTLRINVAGTPTTLVGKFGASKN